MMKDKQKLFMVAGVVGLIILLGFVFLFKGLIGSSGGDTSGILSTDTIPSTEVARGYYGGFTTDQNFVVTDSDTWRKLWTHIYSATKPKPSLPNIDFKKNTVIAAFGGMQNRDKYSLTIDSVVETELSLIAYIIERHPDQRCNVGNNTLFGSPFYIMKISHSEKPVTFKREIKTQECL